MSAAISSLFTPVDFLCLDSCSRCCEEGAHVKTLAHRLDEAINTEIPRLEGLLASSEASLETTRTELATAHEHISTLEADLAEIQQRLVDETDRLEGQVEEQKRLLSEGRKELDKERGEKRRVVGILAQTRASEAALKEEVER